MMTTEYFIQINQSQYEKENYCGRRVFYLVVGNNNKKKHNNNTIYYIYHPHYKSGQQHTTVKTIKRAQTCSLCSQ